MNALDMPARPLFDAPAFLQALRLGGSAAERATLGLLQHYRPLLRAWLRTAGVAAGDVDDLISEILFKAVTGAHALRSAAAFHSWLMQIARHELGAHWQQRQRERQLFVNTPPGPEAEVAEALNLLEQWPDEGLSDPLLRLCLQGQLAHFKQQSQERHACITLIALGHEAAEIAELIGRSYGATRQYMSQCCAALLEALKPCLSEAQQQSLKRGQAQGVKP